MNAERAYTILEARPGLTPSQLKKQYYKKALQCHPDKQGDPEEFHQVQEAYEYLSQQTDDVLPSLFQSSIDYVLSTMDASMLLSLYVLLMDFKEKGAAASNSFKDTFDSFILLDSSFVSTIF